MASAAVDPKNFIFERSWVLLLKAYTSDLLPSRLA
jgi:hypothetical protein